jgi:hypothetical protein
MRLEGGSPKGGWGGEFGRRPSILLDLDFQGLRAGCKSARRRKMALLATRVEDHAVGGVDGKAPSVLSKSCLSHAPGGRQ